jgi:hypothetical protein
MGLTYSSVVHADPDEVFAWHSRPGAITRLMPPWQPVRVAREAPSVRDGQAVLVLPAATGQEVPGQPGAEAGRESPPDPGPTNPDAPQDRMQT